jgi:hypothetical protein
MLVRHVLRQPPRFAGIAGLVTAGLVAVASFAGIFWPAIYARETLSWRVQGTAQDWVDLTIAAPWLAIAAILTLRGSRRAVLLLGGALAYTAYSFAIYAFAVHFNALFLVYVAILGLSAYGLADLGRVLERERVAAWFDERAPRRFAGGALMGFAVVFALLWLARIVPAIAAGTDPPELAEVGLVTNPVHVLDLALVLPLLFVSGVLLRRRRDSGYLLGAILLGFSVLMDAAILAMMIGLHWNGLASDDLLVAVFVVMTVFFAVLLARLLAALRTG